MTTAAVNGAVLLLLGALLVALLYALRATPRARGGARRQPTSVVMNQPAPCHVTACPHIGMVAVRLADETVRVCAGHHDEGYVRGWWTPRPDPTADRTGAAL